MIGFLPSAIKLFAEMVSFEATFSTFGKLDDAQKAQVTAIENILEDYIELEDFELATTDMGFEVIIEGEFPVSTDGANSSAYFLNKTSLTFSKTIV